MRRRFYSVLGATMSVVLGGTVAAWAFFSTTATASQQVTAATLGAPTATSATATGATTITVTVTTGPAAPAASGYVVYPHGTTSTSSCVISGVTGACAVTGLTPGTTTSYDVYSTLGSWVSSASATVSATTPPAKPSAITLVGGGTGGAYVDSCNKDSVEIDVTLPTTSTTGDTVHLTVGDGTTTVTATTKPGTAGSGTVKFTGLDLSALHDGPLTVTAWSTDSGGSSTTLTSTAVKDTAAPAPALSAPAANSTTSTLTPTFTGTAGTQAADSGHSADTTSVTVNVYAGTTATGTPVQALTATVGGGGDWSVAASGALTAGQKYTVAVTQTDAAGNSGTSAPVTFTAGPLPPVALKFVNLSGLWPVNETGYVEMVDVNGNPVANTGTGAIVVTVSGGLLGGHDTVHIRAGDTLTEQFSVLLPLGNTLTATATYNGQTLHT